VVSIHPIPNKAVLGPTRRLRAAIPDVVSADEAARLDDECSSSPSP
jgi:hypothetical protein